MKTQKLRISFNGDNAAVIPDAARAVAAKLGGEVDGGGVVLTIEKAIVAVLKAAGFNGIAVGLVETIAESSPVVDFLENVVESVIRTDIDDDGKVGFSGKDDADADDDLDVVRKPGAKTGKGKKLK